MKPFISVKSLGQNSFAITLGSGATWQLPHKACLSASMVGGLASEDGIGVVPGPKVAGGRVIEMSPNP
ncbi:MAG: hypothetical protein AB7Q64_20560 [Verrucomicrobiales bacterium]